MARWLIHSSTYGTVATHSSMLEGWPFASIISVSDGAVGNSTGRIIFYIATISQLVLDVAADDRASFTVSEAAFAPGCSQVDPEWPTCAKATVLGYVQRLRGADADEAAAMMFARHPDMQRWASMMHEWEFLELVVQQVEVIAYFGGYERVNATAYYSAQLPVSAR